MKETLNAFKRWQQEDIERMKKINKQERRYEYVPYFIVLLAIAILILIWFGLNSCSSSTEKCEKPETQYERDLYATEIVTIDSCEYIYCWFGHSNGGGSLTHKGNCKYCKEHKQDTAYISNSSTDYTNGDTFIVNATTN